MGPWCFCEGGGQQYCTPPLNTPEQINLQVASPQVVVVGFVTYESEASALPPQALFGPSENEMASLTGVTHSYSPPGRNGNGSSQVGFNMPYQMHYIRFNVTGGSNYVYKVKSGAEGALWSDLFKF